MKAACLSFLIVVFGFLGPSGAHADTAADVRALYAQFVAAQNERDLPRVEALLLDSPTFLWVSDGMSVWSRQATIERMATFQQSEIWHVTPDLAQGVVVELTDTTAFLNLPLELAIGSTNPGPDKIPFLVSVLCLKTAQGWRIAALFTTTAKR
jgi:ketosteroid isomerase-like protein